MEAYAPQPLRNRALGRIVPTTIALREELNGPKSLKNAPVGGAQDRISILGEAPKERGILR